MVDQKGKLFGKINLIDFIIILILVALVATVAVRVMHNRTQTSNEQKVHITFYTEEVPDYVPKAMVKGAPCSDATENTDLGKLESFEAAEPLGYVTDTNGEVEAVQRAGYNSLTFDTLASGEIVDQGVKINGTVYSIGQSLTVYAGKTKVYCKIRGIQALA